MLIIDEYLDRNIFLSIKAAIEAASFPWERSLILKDPPAHLDPACNLQDIHGFFLRNAKRQYMSARFDIVRPIINKLKPIDLIKVKVNRTYRKDRHVEYGFHVDTQRVGATTAIFYLNTNNGFTLFDNHEKVCSVENRMVLFDSARSHTGASCTDADYRLVLNINMILPRERSPE